MRRRRRRLRVLRALWWWTSCRHRPSPPAATTRAAAGYGFVVNASACLPFAPTSAADVARPLAERVAPMHGMICAAAIVVLALPLLGTLAALDTLLSSPGFSAVFSTPIVSNIFILSRMLGCLLKLSVSSPDSEPIEVTEVLGLEATELGGPI